MKYLPRSAFALLLAGVCINVAAVAANPSESANWPRFRGPQGTGVSTETNAPVAFGASDILWQTDLPVPGHSSPIVWGERIFLTGASLPNEAADSVRRHVICVARDSGKILWNQVASVGGGEELHKMNSWATPSCVTDGQRVIAFFGPGGLHCFDNQGNKVWSRQLGEFPGRWGVGASPILVDQMVIQNCDAEGDSFLLALDKKTGEEVWRSPRQPKPRGGWSTPIIIEFDGHRELILNGEYGVSGYDPSDGKLLWTCKGFNGRGTPAPAWGHGLLYVVNGKSGDVYAVKPGGSGDVTESRMVWHTDRRGGRDLPSPVLVDDSLVVISMNGIVTAYDAHDGREMWKQRLGGNHAGSPVAIDGLVYALAENGEVTVVRPGKEFQLVARNTFTTDDEIFRSSIAVSDHQLLIRSDRRLYCIASKP